MRKSHRNRPSGRRSRGLRREYLSRRLVRRRNERRGRLERLEDRMMLAGDFDDVSITADQADLLVEGLTRFADVGSAISQSGPFAEPLAVVVDQDGESVRLGDVVDLGTLLRGELVDPIQQYVDQSSAERTTDQWIAMLASLPAVTSVDGGLATAPTDELRFELTLSSALTYEVVGLDFGDNATASGVRSRSGLQTPMGSLVDIRVTFGIDLDPDNNDEQAFYLRDTEIATTADLHTTSDTVDMAVGFLELDDVELSLDFDVDVQTSLVDVVEDELGNITLSELNGYGDSVYESAVTVNQMVLPIIIDPIQYFANPSGPPQITLTGAATGHLDPALSLTQFDELLLFNNIDSQTVVAGLELLGVWLDSFNATPLMDVELPFVQDMTIADTLDPGATLAKMIDPLRGESGVPAFETAQDLETLIGSAFEYDAVGNLLRFPISLRGDVDPSDAPVSIDDDTPGLKDLETESTASIDGVATIDFDFVVDLSSDTATLSDQISVDDLLIDVELDQLADAIAGQARYGVIGVDIGAGSLAGTSEYQADVVNPFSGVSLATLTELFAGLGTPDDLVPGGLNLLSSAELTLSDIAVQENLFAIPQNATFTATVPQWGDSSTTHWDADDIGWLEQHQQLSVDDVLDTLADGLRVAVDWIAESGISRSLFGIDFPALIDGNDVNDLATVIETIRHLNPVTGPVETLQDIYQWVTEQAADEIDDDDNDWSGANFDVVFQFAESSFDAVLTVLGEKRDTTLDVLLNIGELAAATGDGLLQEIGDFVGAPAEIDAELSNYLDVAVQFDLSDPLVPQSYLLDSSAIGANLFVDAPTDPSSGIIMEGALGILGVTFDDGWIVIADDSQNPDPTSPASVTVTPVAGVNGRYTLDEAETVSLTTTSTGQSAADFRVTKQPGSIAEPDRLTFSTTDLDRVDSTTTLDSSPDFPAMIAAVDLADELTALPDALDELLDTVTDALQFNVFGIPLPIIGNALGGPANFLTDVQQTIREALDGLTSFDTDSVECALEVAFGTLDCDEPGLVDVNLEDLTDIRFTLHLAGDIISQSVEIDTDLGLPALGASVSATATVEGTYVAELGFGISTTHGVYLDTTTPPMVVSVDVSVEPNASVHHLEGRLGFLQVGFDVIDSANPTSTDPVTVFHGDFDVDLTDPSGDGKLTVGEALDSLGNLGALIDSDGTGLTGGTGASAGDSIDLFVTASVGLPGMQWMPSVVTTLEIDWQFDGSNLTGGDGSGSDYVPSIRYSQVGLKLSDFMEQTVVGFLDQIGFLIDPMVSIVDALEEPIPVISDIIGDTSIMDIARAISDAYGLLPGDTGFSKALDRWLLYANLVKTLGDLRDATDVDDDAIIYFGDLNFGGIDARIPDQVLDLISMVGPIDDVWNKINSPDAAETFVSLFNTVNEQAVTADAGEFAFPIFDDPYSIFGWLLGIDQAEIITWELPSVSLDIPINLGLTFFGFLNVGLFGSIEAKTDIKVGLDTYGLTEFFASGDPLDFFQGFYVSDRENADGTGDDVPELEVSGEVLAGASIGFDLAALLDLGFLGIESLGLEGSFGGGISADVMVDIIEENGDGKLRGKELRSAGYCLSLEGGIYAEVEASATVGVFHYDYPFVHDELVDLDYSVPCLALSEEGYNPAETLAGLDKSTGELRLFVGPDASQRLIEPLEVNESFHVSLDGNTIVVSAFGLTQEFSANAVQSIVADAADGDDSITIGAEVEIDAWLFGGEGDDTLTGGGGNDRIETGDGINLVFAGPGNDTVIGGAQRDVIYGGEGRDEIDGDQGDDHLLGEGGVDDLDGGDGDDQIDGGDNGDSIDGGSGADTLLGGDGGDTIDGADGRDYIEGGLGEDTLSGGKGIDIVHGNEDADTINGNEGNDLLFGGSGNDTIKGQLGDDIIEGGEDRDFLFGGSGNDDINGDGGGDEISGGVGNDTLIGGEGADTIFGNEENLQELSADETDDDLILAGDDSDSVFGNQGDDTIDGEAGNDLILSGGDGDDTVYGGDGDDVIAGDAGFDELFGEDHDDVIDGGDQDDTIRGGGGDDQISGNNGNDLLFGDADNDSIRGGLGHDEIDGGAGNDYLVGNRGHDDIYGNYGDDVVEGNEGDDRLRGNEGHDLMYGDDGRDDMAGGPGNDTMRGGRDVDIMRGGDGDDLILGHTGSDELFGDGGNDVIKGFTGNDTIDGGGGNDRVDGQDGEDAIDGGAGDDLLRGGSGNDTVDGGDGDDQLHGDQGVDVLLGGDDDDFLIAGNGIGNRLAGGDGDDHLVGSDDGSDDPDFSDAIPFGDILIGGRGDDTIEGLGGADVIDAGLGNDLVWGGNHGDQIVSGFATPWPAADDDTVYGGAGDDRIDDAAGTNLLDGNEGADTINGVAVAVPPVPAPSPAFSMSVGIEVDGYWEELSDSATKDGLTQVGGFEEAVYADDSGVYVAWVDWRNGNSEIYLAYHNDGSGDWIELGASASGGGISNDPQQSRRPTIAKAGDELLVAWTSIDENGNTNIETALQSLNWGRRSTTGQTGKADHAQLVSYNGDSALLAWIDTTSGTPRVYLDQYAQTACVQNYLSTKVAVYPQMFSTAQVDDFDLGTLQHQAAVAISHSGGDDNDVEVWYSRIANLYDETVLCTGVNPPNVELHAPGIWEQIGSFQEGHNVEPAVAILLTDSNGPNEIATEVYVAWHGITDREDQIHAQVREFGFFQSRDWEVIEPQALGGEPRDVATISDTIGYAAIPDLDANGNAVFLAWMDDGVHQDFSNDSSAYVMVAIAGTPVFFERVEHDASGGGISDTGGAMLSLSMEVAAESDAPYVVWTEAKPGKPQLYLRHDLNVEHPTKPPGDPDSGGDKPPVVDRRWQNKINRFDVNDDGRVSTLDALIVINELGRRPSGPLPQNEVPRYFFDSSGDGNLSPLDALRVINEIARRLSRAAVIPDNPDQPPVDVPTIESLDPVDVDRVFATGMDEEERFGEFDVELPSRLF